MASILKRSLSLLLAFVGTSFLLPIAVAYLYHEHGGFLGFGIPMVVSWLLAIVLWLRHRGKFGIAGGGNVFVLVGSAWIAISVFGAIPLAVCGHYGPVDALFESVSGFTTTGSSALVDVESLPHCVNLWRCQTQWLGGMGFVGLVVALLPIIGGGGGYRMVLAEETGPEKGKLTSRVSDTVKLLWLIYISLTAAQFVLLHLFGMSWFDALCHAFSTLGTGGFSTRNGSIAAFGNPAIEWICTLFMLLGSLNFGVYYLLVAGKWRELRHSSELKGFGCIVLVAVAAITLIEVGEFASIFEVFRHVSFQVASIVSTSGFMVSDYTTWRPAAQLMLLMLFLVGGCSGSTAGGIKVIRWVALAKGLCKDIRQMIHPHGVFAIRINGAPVHSRLVATIGSFVFVYFLMVAITALCGALCGQDIDTAFTAALSMVGNVGPAFGALGPTDSYAAVSPVLKLIYCMAMLAGRLEVYTLLILVGHSMVHSRRSGTPSSK